MAIASSPGWSETGGPWVKPEQAMKKLVWSELRIPGGTKFAGALPKPPNTTGPFQDVPRQDELAGLGGPTAPPPQYYADAAVIAYRLPAAATPDLQPAMVTSSAGRIDAAVLNDGDLVQGVKIPIGKDGGGGWLQYEYAAPYTVRAATVARPPAGMFMPGGPLVFRLESSGDGRRFIPVADLPTTRVAQQTVEFPPVTARYFRLKIDNGPPPEPFGRFEPAPGADPGFFAAIAVAGAKAEAVVNEFVLHSSPRVNRFEEKAGFGLVPDYYALASSPVDATLAVRKSDVVDLTARMKPDGSLEWTPPEGQWVILRLGYSLTGTTNHPATAEATGLEVDKLDQRAVKSYIDTYLGSYLATVGRELMGRHGVKALLTDSIEVGPYNWTPDILAQFKRLRGYDPTPFLPALTGVVVGSAEQSDAFLWDFRRTLAVLTAESHYGQIAKSAHEHGLIYYGESLEGTRVSIGDDMEMRRNADIPMAAMWTYSPAKGPRSNYVIDIKGAASVAHIYGQNLVAAESMTSAMAPWGFSPRTLKPIIDLEFALGVNRPVIHTSVHQPLEKKPGLGLLIFGQYFNRHETWAEQAGPWVTYIARNAHILQQGKFAADVAYFYGEEAPLAGLYGEGRSLPKDLPAGYGFDFVNSDALLHQLSFANGGIGTASGMRYRVLYLGGSSRRMTLPVLRTIRDLVKAGAMVVGDRPTGSPSLADNGAEFTAIADALWGKAAGGRKVIEGVDGDQALASAGVAPDFDYDNAGPERDVMFVHRRLPDGDIYFLLNRTDRPRSIKGKFRTSGKRPELWHSDTGVIAPVSYRIVNGRTTVPLQLAANESVFVVFRQPASEQAVTVPARSETPLATLDGPWELRFAVDLGGPAKVTFDHLASWTENMDPCGTRHQWMPLPNGPPPSGCNPGCRASRLPARPQPRRSSNFFARDSNRSGRRPHRATPPQTAASAASENEQQQRKPADAEGASWTVAWNRRRSTGISRFQTTTRGRSPECQDHEECRCQVGTKGRFPIDSLKQGCDLIQFERSLPSRWCHRDWPRAFPNRSSARRRTSCRTGLPRRHPPVGPLPRVHIAPCRATCGQTMQSTDESKWVQHLRKRRSVQLLAGRM